MSNKQTKIVHVIVIMFIGLVMLFKFYFILLRTYSWTDGVNWTYKKWGWRKGEKFNIVTYWGYLSHFYSYPDIYRYNVHSTLHWAWYLDQWLNCRCCAKFKHLKKKKYKAIARELILKYFVFKTSHRKFILDQQ